MQRLAFLCVALALTAGCSQLHLQQPINPLADLDATTTDQIVIAETGALVSQIASVDVYINDVFIGNTGDAPVLMTAKSAGTDTLAVEGRFGAAYAERTEVQLEAAEGHQFVLIEPTLRGPIAIRVVSRVQWEALAK